MQLNVTVFLILPSNEIIKFCFEIQTKHCLFIKGKEASHSSEHKSKVFCWLLSTPYKYIMFEVRLRNI